MVTAVIVAAGSGTRMGKGMNKLFIPLKAHPLIAYTLARFDECKAIDEIVLVTRPDSRADFAGIVKAYGIAKKVRFTDGGAERQDSVWSGLNACSTETQVVLIHDGARPCITSAAIESIVKAAREHGAAVVATKVTDTIKEADDERTVVRTVDRSRLWAVQTPQGFRIDWLREGYAEVRRQGKIVTDDTAAVELIGKSVKLVENTSPNLKVTSPGDVPVAEWLLRDHELRVKK